MYRILLIFFNCFILLNFCFSQQGEFIYSGEPFVDPEWGRSYKTSEQDRVLLKNVDEKLKTAAKKLLENVGDYNLSTDDMSFFFDAEKQQEYKANGTKCVTCIYSTSPSQGQHFRYKFNIRMEMIEDSKTFMRKGKLDDSLNTIQMNDLEQKRKANNSEAKEKQMQKEMEEFQKEVEKMDMSKLTSEQLEAIAKNGEALGAKADANDKAQQQDNVFFHNLFAAKFAGKIDVLFETNNGMLAAEKSKLLSLKNSPDYFFEELKIPGCSFACIYFDRYMKSDFSFHENPVFIAYNGNVYDKSSSLPREWVKPFCVRVTFSGNMEQIKQVREKIDFSKLKEILSN